MQIETNEYKNLVIWSYELTVKMPNPKKDGQKYGIESRSKFKSLPEALRHLDDPSASITHFVKNAAYFLPRKEGRLNPEKIMPFLEKLIERVTNLNDGSKDPEVVREELKCLIGYANWNADAICAILTATEGDVSRAKDMIRKMLQAELSVIDAQDKMESIYSQLERWAFEGPDSKGSDQRGHQGGYHAGNHRNTANFPRNNQQGRRF